MGVPRPARNGRPRTLYQSSQLLQPPGRSEPDSSDPSVPDPDKKTKFRLLDPNMSNPRLLVNRACIYERRLPGDAYITAHVARLQHGYYASEAVSDKAADHVDFLAVNFVFHTTNTLTHRFKSATIKAAIRGNLETATSPQYPHGFPLGNPRFLMHAPHLIFGHVSPETMEWTFSLAGSLGVSETPVSASVIPSGSTSARYRRYEMMRIQGSARTLKSLRGPQYDVEAGEIVWSLEENNLQRSGLPREFTFVMLVQKPTANCQLTLTLEIEPVIQAVVGSYPSWLLAFGPYQPLPRRGVDFNSEVGQRFEPVDAVRGYNFAALDSAFDEYIAMPGRKFTRQIEFPVETADENNNQGGNTLQSVPYYQGYPLSGAPNPLQQLHFNGMVLQNNMLQALLNQLSSTHSQAQPAAFEVHHSLDNETISRFAGLHISPAPAMSRVVTEGSDAEAVPTICCGSDARFRSYENIRASMLRTVHPGIRSDTFKVSSSAERAERKARVERSGSRQQLMRLKDRSQLIRIARHAEQCEVKKDSEARVDAE